MTQLLVSVRSVEEADTALAGGADIIDVKEPARGSLGKADEDVITSIIDHVAGRQMVSVALGELTDLAAGVVFPVSDFVKVGLAGWGKRGNWRGRLSEVSNPRLVPVAYADAERANSPALADVLDFAVAHRCGALLIDTWQKDGRGLLHWLSLAELGGLRDVCASAGLPLALAGSLGVADVERLLPLTPEIVAVRGAACRGGQRNAAIDRAAVAQLARICKRYAPRASSTTAAAS
jgi:hypothetical protein